MVSILNLKVMLSNRKAKVLICSLVLGFLIAVLFSGKSNYCLKSIAVSPNEEYIVCFEASGTRTIHCYRADGSLAFNYEVPTNVSAGGNCALWFDNDVICALFYRTDKILHFTLDGKILKSSENSVEDIYPQYPYFTKKANHYVYSGEKIIVTYDEESFVGYWLLEKERYLAITTPDGDTKTLLAWTATDDPLTNNGD